MLIKKRLAISNILMIAIPTIVALLIVFVSLAAIWIPSVQRNNIGVRDLEDFERTGTFMLTQVEGKLQETAAAGREPKISDVSAALRQVTGYTVRVEGSTGELWTWGDAPDAESLKLQDAADQLSGDGIISNGDHAIATRNVVTKSGEYRVYIYGSEIKTRTWPAKNTVKWSLIFLFVIFIIGIIVANKFLTRFVFQRIRSALDLLASGVRQIRDGNLKIKLIYDGKDEIAPICEAFNDMARRLEESVTLIQKQEQNRKELLAGISHDLRSPLTSIKAYAEGLQDGIATTPELKEKYVRMIQTKADEMEHMISNLFTFSKMDLDEYPSYPEKMDLGEHLTMFIRNESESYKNKGLILHCEAIESGTMIWADPFQIRNIVANIADNSVKYKVNDMGNLYISCQNQADTVELILQDDGPGANEASLDRLFNVFYRSDAARSNPHKGSGLGLAIVKKMVQQMGGTIEAKSAAGEGLSIIMKFPKYGG